MNTILKENYIQYFFILILICCCNNLQNKKNMKIGLSKSASHDISINKNIINKQNQAFKQRKNFFKTKFDKIIDIKNNLLNYLPKINKTYSINTSLNYITKTFLIGSILLENIYLNKVNALEGFIVNFNFSVFSKNNLLSVVHNDLDNTDIISGNFDSDQGTTVFLSEYDRENQIIKWSKYYDFSLFRSNTRVYNVKRTLDLNYTFFALNRGNHKEILIGKVNPIGNPLTLKGIEFLDSDIFMDTYNYINIIENEDGELIIFLVTNKNKVSVFIRLNSDLNIICINRINDFTYPTSKTFIKVMIELNNTYIILGINTDSPPRSVILFVNENCEKIDSFKTPIYSGASDLLFTSILEKEKDIYYLTGFLSQIFEYNKTSNSLKIYEYEDIDFHIYALKKTTNNALAIIGRGLGTETTGNLYQYLRGQINEDGTINNTFGFSGLNSLYNMNGNFDPNYLDEIVIIGESETETRSFFVGSLPNQDFLECENTAIFEPSVYKITLIDANVTFDNVDFQINELNMTDTDFDLDNNVLCLETDPTNGPTTDPTNVPTTDPTNVPTIDPTNLPTTDPTNLPTADPTTDPTNDPTTDPTFDPTNDPTTDPTNDPTTDPTFDPTNDPTADPTNDPTTDPTFDPTNDPTTDPTFDPTNDPTIDPTNDPTIDPTINPATLDARSNEDDVSSIAIILPVVLGSICGFIILLILYRMIKNHRKKQYLNVEETEYDINL